MSVVGAFFDWIDGWNGPYELPILIAAVATLLSEAWMPWCRRLWRDIRKMIAFNRVSAEVAPMPADERLSEVSAGKDIRSHSSTRRSGGPLCYAADFSATGADAAVRETPLRPRCSGNGSHGTMMGLVVSFSKPTTGRPPRYPARSGQDTACRPAKASSRPVMLRANQLPAGFKFRILGVLDENGALKVDAIVLPALATNRRRFDHDRWLDCGVS